MSILVLMSTYNGEKYIAEQIDSILCQKNVEDIKILIRDDGSRDGTISIIEDYIKDHNNIILIKGHNVGCEESFNLLASYANKKCQADYYAFCDQDDIWMPDKLQTAINILNTYDSKKPNLYFSNLTLVDSNLIPLYEMYNSEEVIDVKKMTFIQLFIFACTSVFNKTALQYYCKPEKNNCNHDHWIFIICSLLGNVYYDSSSHILYRQHANNVSGDKEQGYRLQLLRFQKLIKGKIKGHLFENLAIQFDEYFNQCINPKDLESIYLLKTYRHKLSSKIKLLFSSNYTTGNFYKDFAIKYRIITNHL